MENTKEEVVVQQSRCKCNLETWGKTWPMLFFLFIGIINAVLMKLSFIFEAEGEPKYGIHSFQKPWFITAITFFGMALAVPVYMFMCVHDYLKGDHKLILLTDLSFKDFAEFSIPALSDIFENIVSAVCVVFVSVSIDSMMKSGTLVGVSLISRFIFHVHYAVYKWVSIGFVVMAMTMVGAAGIINSGSSVTVTTSKGWVALIVALKFISQVGYAIRISYEEYFARVKHYHPVMICGLECCWSTFISAFILMPISQYLPGPEGNGIHEDSIDTLKMIGNDWAIFTSMLLMLILGLVYNVVSATLISRTSAVVRTLMEAFRTFLIWMVQFLIFYTFRTNDFLRPYMMAGEEWGLGSYIQLAGFVLMTFAVLAYNKIPKYPCYNYEYDQYIDTTKGTKEVSDEEYFKNEKELEIFHDARNGIVDEASTETTTNENEVTIEENVEGNVKFDVSDDSIRSMSLGIDDEDDPL